jgi:hypothetical protein
MSAAPPRPFRVLRAAVVIDDAVCAELHQTKAGSVSVGTNYKSDLLVYGKAAPERWPLFQFVPKEGAYYLNVPNGARGKVKVGGRTMSIAKLQRRVDPKAGHVRLKLDPKARGKLRIGEAMLMFQLAKPKPVPPKMPFPAVFRASVFAMVGALYIYSQLASATILGPFFAWAYFSEVPPDIEPDERWVAMVGNPDWKKKEKEEEEDEAEKDDLADEEEEEEAPDKKKPEPKKLAEKPQKFSKQAMKEARSVGVARVLGTYGGPGEGTVFDVIQDTENNLGELFAQGMTTTVLADGGPIGEFVPGGEGISLRGSAVGTQGFETEGPGLDNKVDKRERKVVGRTKTSKTDITGGGDAKALRATIKHRTSALQHCYNKALRTQPDLAGKMTYTIFISVMGTVTKVVIEEDSLGSGAVATCTKTKIRGWRFPMNGADEGAEVTFSVVFSGS